ncbi:DUF2637 domain-containing protein [Actinomadura gamaensis]|uniref:DUF2637 domain-containing protein n=1 Tax=Actinomadura gamaensis TaxID=1763541 RepID=A0ABV9UB28_9ACTN
MSTPHAIPTATAPDPAETASASRIGLVDLAVIVIAAAAGLLSLDGQRRLAAIAGWHGWHAWLLPIAVETYAALSTWLMCQATTRTARYRMAAYVGIGVGLSGALNVVWHLVAADVITPSWRIVVGVALVPTILVALALHLAAGHRAPAPAAPDEHQADEPAQRRRYRVSRALVDAAAQALADATDPRTVTGVELARRDPDARSVRAWQMALAEARTR